MKDENSEIQNIDGNGKRIQLENNKNIAPTGILPLLKNRDFSPLFIGGLISDIGSFFTFIAVMFLAIDITSPLGETKAAQAIALITVFMIIPSATLGPLSGAIVDRLDRKMVMIMADLAGAITSFGLVYVAIFNPSMFLIYIFSFLSACSRIFFYPARGAAIPKVVNDPDQLVRANSIIQTFSMLSRVIGPALAGFTIAFFGIETAFIIDGVSYLLSTLLISLIKTDLTAKKLEEPFSIKGVTVDLKKGFLLVKDDRIVRFILIIFSVAILAIGMIDPLFVTYLNYEFGLTEQDFGLILSLSSISGFLAAIVLSSKGEISKKLTFAVSSMFIVAISLVSIGLAASLDNSVFLLYGGMMLVGMVNVVFSIPIQALLQTIVENENLGKVNGFMGTSMALAQVVGASLASGLAGLLSIQSIFIGVGIFSLFVGVMGLFIIKITDLEEESLEREDRAKAEQRKQKLESEKDTLEEKQPVAPNQDIII